MWTLLPGERSDPRNLDEMLREYHELVAEMTKRMREEAEAAGNPTDGLEDLGPYVSDPDAAGVEVELRAVDRKLFRRVTAKLDAIKTAGKSEDEVLAALDKVDDLKRQLVAHAVATVRGLRGMSGPVALEASGEEPLSEAQLDVLDAAGLMDALFIVAKRFQLLTGEKKRLYGVRAPRPTSTISSAIAAPSLTEALLGAREAEAHDGKAASTRTTPAHDGGCSGSLGSSTPTSSTPPPTAGS